MQQSKITRVCMISPTFPYMNCGVGDYTFEFIKSLKDYGLEVGVITSKSKKIEEFIKDTDLKGIKLFPIISHWDFTRIALILRKIKEFKPDIIHIQYHWWISNDGFIIKGLMLVLLPAILKILQIKSPIVTTLHSRMNGPYLFRGAGFLRRWALIPILLFSDKIMVTNKFDGRSISKKFPFLRKKIAYVTGGTGHYLEDKRLKNQAIKVRSELKVSEKEILLSNFGYMIPYKGLEELLEAMSILKRRGYPLKLLAIGGFDIETNFVDSYLDKLKKMAERLNIKSQIKWTGFCDCQQASLFLLASDICVVPFTDGVSEWRSTFLGALSHSLPIVTTYSEKTPEELINKVNCMLVSPKDPLRLASAIEELIVSPELRESIGRAAGELYEKEYHWPVIAQKTIEVYKN